MAHVDLCNSCIDATLGHGLTASELVHSLLAEVDTLSNVVHSHKVDAVAVVSGHRLVPRMVFDRSCQDVRDLVTLSALRAIPSGNVARAANEWEAWDSSLYLVAVLGDQAIVTV